MTLKEIFDKGDFQKVYEVLLEYEDVCDSKKHIIEKGFIEIQQMNLEVSNSEDMIVHISKCFEDGDLIGYDVSGEKQGEEYFYSLVFCDVEEWLSYRVDKKTLEEFSEDEIAAHCFWEMTFSGGWTVESRKLSKELMEEEQVIREDIEIFKASKNETFIHDNFLDHIIKIHKKAEKNQNVRFNLELMVEELIEGGYVSPEQTVIIESYFDDEDILDKLKSLKEKPY